MSPERYPPLPLHSYRSIMRAVLGSWKKATSEYVRSMSCVHVFVVGLKIRAVYVRVFGVGGFVRMPLRRSAVNIR